MSKLSNWLHKAEKAISNVIPHQHSADKRKANEAVAQQISFYQEQRDQLASETKRTTEERAAEKQKVARKQIRSARRAYRAPGFMDQQSGSYSETLGG